MRPISFKKATKAQKREFMDAIEAEMMETVEAQGELRAQLRLPSLVRENLSIESIRIAFGGHYIYHGVPVTPDQLTALTGIKV